MELNSEVSCTTLINNLGAVGCRSAMAGGEAGRLVVAEKQADLDALFQDKDVSRRAVLLNEDLFTLENMLALKKSSRCSGILLARSDDLPTSGVFSPANPMRYCKCEEQKAPSGCSGKWNVPGNSLSEQSFNFPIIAVNSSRTAQLKGLIAQVKPWMPALVVRMNFYMDVFQGFRLEQESWWELQQVDSCCPNCRPNCAGSCCDFGFECTSSKTHPVSWAQPTCARQKEPTSYDCIGKQTCLPLGGYNIWSVDSPSFPPPPSQGIIVAAAAMDSSAFFHDLAEGASSQGSAVVALIAAADALKDVRRKMQELAGTPIVFALLQGEQWDHIGSRKLLSDIANFSCRKIKTSPSNGLPNDVCVDPPMLSPEIVQLRDNPIDFVLEVDQLTSAGGELGESQGLFFHTGCSPSDSSVKARELVLKQASVPGVAGVASPDEGLPFPPSTIVGSVLEEATGQQEARKLAKAPKGRALLAGYSSHFTNPFYQSRFDKIQSGGAELRAEGLCRAASRLSMVLYSLSTGAEAPALHANCTLVRELAGKIMWKHSEQEAPSSSYTSVYQPPTLRGPSERERFLFEQLAMATSAPGEVNETSKEASACDCCDPSGSCQPVKHFRCLQGKCVRSFAFFQDALPLGVAWDVNQSQFVLSQGDRNMSHVVWTESNWQLNLGAMVYLEEETTVEQAVFACGLVLCACTFLLVSSMSKYYERRFKHN
ncbi:hypothetical protein GUITHDRAFT_113369 [Guillardia theta CCMP2712]|uniref:Nicastrin n=1 Tax=Guillardia theta (strain CCMP2712) TaxID=905079 RepID=L1IWT9_GUITC|nr:hypothetical protein GUITHDRAFT_113369 [Guillardia theta CCMP2712]EKX40582.1 hypothetical protein GUITHDRAFT_113369 [Guillardia theta CCMP2712]|eukprot:XP_005827562.1 hypothetical protein GUITHDRAFT_113369 [Guillardia theta CCMP2712]